MLTGAVAKRGRHHKAQFLRDADANHLGAPMRKKRVKLATQTYVLGYGLHPIALRDRVDTRRKVNARCGCC